MYVKWYDTEKERYRHGFAMGSSGLYGVPVVTVENSKRVEHSLQMEQLTPIPGMATTRRPNLELLEQLETEAEAYEANRMAGAEGWA